MTTRYNLGDFNIANPVYAGATVSFYTVSGGAKTTTLATLYAASTGTTQGSNPATLDSDGKLSAPLYAEVPVIATITGLGSVADHDTGIMGLAEGAASTSATAAAASAAAALVSETNTVAAVATIGHRKAASVAGTVDAITAVFSPVFASLAASAGIVLAIPLAGANATTTPTLAIDGLTAKTIVKSSNTALAAGDIPGADFVGLFVYDASLDKFQLINPVSSTEVKAGIQAQTYVAYTTGGSSTAYTLTPTPALTALAENQEFDVEFHTAAGATPTLAVSGLTAKNLKYRDSNGAAQAITSTQVPSGWRSKVTYDGTDYIVREVAAISGTIVRVVEATPITSVVTCNVAIPKDDTIPQNTEGVEVITQAITPKSATNRLRIEFDCSGLGATSATIATAALFQDSTADAIAVSTVALPNSEMQDGPIIRHEMAAGTTSATTFKVRIGAAVSVYVNGEGGGARRYGGISAARLRIIEIKG